MRVEVPFFRRLLIAIVCLVSFVEMSAQIEINNETQLRAIANDLAGDYELTSDITLSQEWIPIGDEENRFTGTIKGNGKTIYGLRFDNPDRNGAGFIGVAEGAVIENLRIVDARVYGGQAVGGVVGRIYAPTTITQCYTSGVFRGYDHVGGIVGGTESSGSDDDLSFVADCYSTAAVISTGWQSGGIIGAAINSQVSNSYFAGIAACPSGRSAGIVAFANGGEVNIEKSVSLSPFLKGDEANRVLGGSNEGVTFNLSDNYSWEGTEVFDKNGIYLDGVSDRSGKDGEHMEMSTLQSASFYTSVLGWNSSIWKSEEGKYPIFANQVYPLQGDAIYFDPFPERALPGNTHKTNVVSALGRVVSCFSSNQNAATIDADGLVSFINNGTTTLTFSTQGDSYSDGVTYTYDLTVEGISYNIATENDLRNIKYDLSGEFTLMNNITLTEDWTPIEGFKGILNGNGKIIYNLKIDQSSTAKRALFSETEGAVITKLGIEKAHIVGNEDVGAIVGVMKGGLLEQCYVADSYITGRDHVGSLVGKMSSYDKVVVEGDPDNGIEEVKEKVFATVSNCHAGAQVYSREFQAGGVVGIICGGTIENCYFSGTVQSIKGRIGGIVSLVDSDDEGEIKNNLNLTVAGYCGENTYRIADWGGRGPEDNYCVRFTNNWSKEASYFGTDYTNAAVQNGQKDDNRNGGNLSDDNNARKQQFYTETLGWDFTNKWKFIAGTEGKLYPVLAWQEAPLVSNIYGIPEPAYLIWTEAADAAIDLKRIISTTGQPLTFEVTEGSQYVEIEGSLLYVTEGRLTEGGWSKLAVKTDASLEGKLAVDIHEFDVEVMLDGAVVEIATAEQFLAVNDKLFASFRLMNNIDLRGVDFKGIGSSDTPFTGTFDGNGYSILNAVVKTNGENRKGLFNATKDAKISKLGVADISFKGVPKDKGVDIGGLVGSCKNTTIEECYLTGTITGTDHVGGFVGGDADGVTIKNSYVDVTIQAGQQAGGFFGVTAGSVVVENCYYTGNIEAISRGWVGGIIGLIDRSGDIRISGSVSIGDLSSAEVAGYHIGGNMKDGDVERGNIALFVRNMYNIDASIRTNGNEWILSSEVPGVQEEAIPSLPASLCQQATYTAIGWDFNTIWEIEEGVSYPTLKNVKSATSSLSTTFTAPKYTVYASDNNIYISGIKEEALVTVYGVSGQLVSQTIVTDGASVPVDGKGLYILKITEDGVTTPTKVLCK